ncbi:MAG: PQQ-binding-like beta-propeller repeat protein, partial [Planctomycetales bacterium]|nr:PQQ-binding-like beta-propeller repeat protein [Planctomycetales bacterium]
KPHLRGAAQAALVASARAEDASLLKDALTSDNAHVRAAATAALGSALGEAAESDLRKMTEDPNDDVRLAAARAMADYGQRDSLNVLIDLLGADEVETRTHASGALRSLTQQYFGYAAYDVEANRNKAVEKWRNWLAAEGQTAKLSFPLKPFGHGVSFLNGNTLLAFGNRHKVVELDPAGKEIWSYSVTGAWSAEKMASGNVLIASNSQSKVIEVNREGKVVWEYATPNPLNAKPLPNGNVLIAGFTQRRVMEVSRDKKIVWEHSPGQYVSDCHRLENGNTLISMMNGPVREITPDGKTAWEYSGARQAYGCQPLANGNVLIASLSGEIMEVTRDNKVVWEHREQNPADVFRLPNGNTLITGARRFVELTPDKKEVWTLEGCQYGSARR